MTDRPGDGEEADPEGDPGAVQDAAEDVAPRLIGAEPVLGGGRLEQILAPFRVVVRSDKIGEQSDQQEKQDDHTADHRGPVTEKGSQHIPEPRFLQDCILLHQGLGRLGNRLVHGHGTHSFPYWIRGFR